tara:strand:- start:80 stop:784 length:705 start_codon:yes stop_codon:yes gene_type:complete
MFENDLKNFNNKEEMAQFALAIVAGVASRCKRNNLPCRIALSGGTTPDALFKLLAKDAGKTLPLDLIDWFWVDERLVPHECKDSNYGRAKALFIDKLNIPAERLHPVQTEVKAPAECYAKELESVFGSQSVPRFELILLGMGGDGHTASMFPGSSGIWEKNLNVIEVPAPKNMQPHVPRITLTFPVINQAEKIVFMVSGQEKCDLLRYIGSLEKTVYPVQLVRKDNVEWLVTEQ